jgi:predicted nucleotidyltransferase
VTHWSHVKHFSREQRDIDDEPPRAEPRGVIHERRPPPELLNALVSGIDGVLGDDLIAVWLFGSSVTGDFDPEVSDVDLVAVTSSRIESIYLSGLERMHQCLAGRFPDWEDRVEVVYISRGALESFQTSVGGLAVISPGEPFHVRDDRLSEWLQTWYLVRETGVSLYGPAPTAIVPPITKTEFIAAIAHYADELRDRSRAGVHGGAIAYAVLTMCRALLTVRLERIKSKQEAAAWARERMPEWAWLIDAAAQCRRSRGAIGFEDAASRAGAEIFIALVADEISGHGQP